LVIIFIALQSSVVSTVAIEKLGIAFYTTIAIEVAFQQESFRPI
jgi:hypothetical protein